MEQRIYLDHAATTYTKPEVLEEMLPYFTKAYGNPSSVHSFGREARRALDKARKRTAEALKADPVEIYFTSGGSEADNWAIKGVALANKNKGDHIITTSIEHPAVLDTCRYLEKEGFKVTYLPVDQYGMVSVKDVEKAITDKTILISVMMANNEIGTIQPIKEIGQIAKEHKVYFHTDAVQAIGSIPIDVNDLNVDLLSLSAHKFYGPNGVGALYIRKGVKIGPYIHGGAQERNKRAGTENLAGIIGLGKAIELAVENMEKNNKKLIGMRDRLIKEIMSKVEYTRLNGHPEKRLPGNVNLSFEFIEGEALLLSLDLKGIAGSSGSACTSGSLDPSHVLLAIGLSHEIAHGSLRLTLGDDNTDQEIDYVIEVLPEIVNRLREMSPLFAQDKGGLEYV
ncbi:MAG: cysteine desulfurase NifS [Caldicoprobacterales bacterium]|jgi:cysteine desulfurase|nr:cysteine desulfurase NifS [Clostridia bacterium]MDI9511852.1 cysteine desulfurase NifS [Bacillota bacterium]NLH59187.1 cysteine desulfurase NifS [Clostridiales bacterium]